MYNYNLILKIIIKNNNFKKKILTSKKRAKKIFELREILIN